MLVNYVVEVSMEDKIVLGASNRVTGQRVRVCTKEFS